MFTKYDNEASDCHGWVEGGETELSEHDNLAISHTIFEAMKVQPGHVLFEWGSGCGSRLKYAEDYHNATGLGIDMSRTSLEYALRHTTTSAFCLVNGKILGWIPDKTFDGAFSFASLYLLGTTVKAIEESKLCMVMAELVRIVKPDSKVVIAGNLAGVHLPEAYFHTCYKRFLWKKYNHALSFQIHRDYQWFPHSLKHYFGPHGRHFKSFSVVMKRMQ